MRDIIIRALLVGLIGVAVMCSRMQRAEDYKPLGALWSELR